MSLHLLDRPAEKTRTDIQTVGERERSTEVKTDGERVKDEFEALWDMYTGRRVGLSISYSNWRAEDDIIATRYYDESAIEETYWRTQFFSDSAKSMREMVTVRIKTDTGEHEIFVDEDSDVSVKKRLSDSDEWHMVDDDEAEACLFEFFHRTSDAKVKHESRTQEEKDAADRHAVELLLERYPDLGTFTMHDE